MEEASLPIVHQAARNLLGVESRGLLAEIDVAVDVAGQRHNVHVGNAVRVGERPKRCLEAQPPDRANELPCVFDHAAFDGADISADRRILPHIAGELLRTSTSKPCAAT